jgi:ABC-type polysaccharide transport system permease subunit
VIVLDNVTKRFGAVTAVDSVSFRADKGKFVVLLGPSGCGKSTLLRLIAGLEEVSEGKILIEGRDVTRLDPTRRRISNVFQSYALFPHLTVAENIVFGLRVRKLPPAERSAHTPQIGLLDKVTAIFGGAPSHNWLGNPDTVMGCVIAMTIWKEAGFFMIFYLAALPTMLPELKEAARIEGASRGYFFWRVTFPLLMPTTLFVLVNATINSFKLVDHLFILTKGGPDNASNLLLYYIYQVAFSYLDSAYAATLTVILLFILAGFAVGSSNS